MRIKAAILLCLACVGLSACSANKENKAESTVQEAENMKADRIEDSTEEEDKSEYVVDWENIRVELFECNSFTQIPSDITYTSVNVLYTAPEEYKTDSGLVYNPFRVIDDYYDIKLVSDNAIVFGMRYDLYHNPDYTEYRQAVGSYIIDGEVDHSDLRAVVYKKDTQEEVYSWNNLRIVDEFIEPAATLFRTNQGSYVVNHFYYGSGSSSKEGFFEYYDMDKVCISTPADGEYFSLKKLTGSFELKTRDGEVFAEVCGLEPYTEITDNQLSFGVYCNDPDFDLRDKSNELGLILEYTDNGDVQSWVIYN